MAPSKNPIADAIPEALRQACVERRFDVAEHLPAGLETLETDCDPGTPLAAAYMIACSSTAPRPVRR
ncbi:hypothetical protein [Inquilinus sp. OTU3971]|uniref:hypothetical protein n=1 Tax=Inquilinus sp. OTU3971 TaxID=3043855 RepID=UPI00313C184A